MGRYKKGTVEKFYFFFLWLLGFVVLFAFDLFMELIVFEWLQWNGTTKNDWFFMLWWICVFLWLLYGLYRFFKEIKLKSKR